METSVHEIGHHHQLCMEDCAIKRDCSHFEPKKVFELRDLPRFPLEQWQHEMTPKERQAIAGVYLAKIVDYLQGRQPDVWKCRTRPHTDRSRNGRIPEALKSKVYNLVQRNQIPHLKIGKNG